MMCIALDTPQSIMDEGNDYYSASTDIFAEIVRETGATFVNGIVMQQALWWRWRNYTIGDCDTPFWVRGMADRLLLIGRKWDAIISKAYADDVDLTSITDRDYERIITRTGTDTNVNTPTGSNVSVDEHESLPQTATGSTRYLDSRNTSTDTPSVVTTDELTHNTTDTETYKADDTITAVTFSDMMNNYPNVLLGFVDEFKDYFVDRWC